MRTGLATHSPTQPASNDGSPWQHGHPNGPQSRPADTHIAIRRMDQPCGTGHMAGALPFTTQDCKTSYQDTRSCNHTFAYLACYPIQHLCIVRTYELTTRKPVLTSYSSVICRDNYSTQRTIEARSFMTIHERPVGPASVLEGSMRRQVVRRSRWRQFGAAELAADYD